MKSSSFTASTHQLVHRLWLTRNAISRILVPLAWLVEVLLSVRRWYYTHVHAPRFKSSLPVVVIGNLYAGGTGKTPATIGLIKLLQAKGWRPGVISRGYAARPSREPQCGVGDLSSDIFGDEPALIARLTQVPVCVFHKRETAATKLLAVHPNIDVVICDDGLQHLALARDLEIIVQDHRGVGNGWVQPAGPLREGVHRLAVADVVITNYRGNASGVAGQIPGSALTHRQLAMYQDIVGIRHLASQERLTLEAFLAQHGQNSICAAAAIGEPEQFFQGLRQLGVRLVATSALTDHRALDYRFLASIDCSVILITAKDAIKCDPQLDQRLWSVEVDTRFGDPTFAAWLDSRLTQIQRNKKSLGLQ
ncbi:lipid-A-disaccharide kinase [Jezberella montanilacus]|uniref:Tetraacyldisaccharide 4'-kinase n=1 Tax=Jezberella montanilacus TaxID=323426 RepID=A0A2T0XJI6_9BURK|nr:tetraacyldisaccharide 4'-kinase [Jezberella montanilacus]PRY99108.1 lipid-A-disaccharide kinase [Jezberella montanilacus]